MEARTDSGFGSQGILRVDRLGMGTEAGVGPGWEERVVRGRLGSRELQQQYEAVVVITRLVACLK